MKTRRKILISILGCLVLGITGAEIGLRCMGLIDFPIYDTDPEIGYIPRASQSGKFLNKNSWALNEVNMGTSEKWNPETAENLLLVGDSIVWGGNPIDQKDKLAPRLQALVTEAKIWPVSAGSWTVENPQIWMNRHPEVLASVNRIVWIVNSADFAPASKWSNELTHPRKKPESAILYVAKKYLLPKVGLTRSSSESLGKEHTIDLTIAKQWSEALKKFKDRNIRIVIVLYPTKAELQNKQQYSEFSMVSKKVLSDSIEFLDLSTETTWKDSYYRDEIHPNVRGYQHLAGLIAKRLKTFHPN